LLLSGAKVWNVFEMTKFFHVIFYDLLCSCRSLSGFGRFSPSGGALFRAVRLKKTVSAETDSAALPYICHAKARACFRGMLT